MIVCSFSTNCSLLQGYKHSHSRDLIIFKIIILTIVANITIFIIIIIMIGSNTGVIISESAYYNSESSGIFQKSELESRMMLNSFPISSQFSFLLDHNHNCTLHPHCQLISQWITDSWNAMPFLYFWHSQLASPMIPPPLPSHRNHNHLG